MDRDQQIRTAIVEVGRRMYAKGLIAAADGNVTVRTPEGELYVTPSGACKGDLKPDDIVVTDLHGKPLRGARKPSSEIEMHVAVYDVRPDVFAVVHAHPPLATGFAAAGVPLSPALLSEIVLTLGCVPLTEYATPTTAELAETIKAYAARYDGLLLANHGAVALGKDAFDAYYKMETLEHYAKINLVTKILGSERPIPGEAVAKLVELRRKAGLGDGDPLCAACASIGSGTGHDAHDAHAAPPSPAAARGGAETFTVTADELVALVQRVLAAGPA